MGPYLAGVYRWDNDLLAAVLGEGEVEVVDITTPGLLVHTEVEDGGEGGGVGGGEHGLRKGAQWNERVSRDMGDRWKVGKTSNTPWTLPCSFPPSDLSSPSPRLCHLHHRRAITRGPLPPPLLARLGAAAAHTRG